MAAEVDFGDRELFAQLDSDSDVPAAAQPLHTRFEWEDEDEDEGGGAAGPEADEEAEELRARLRDCEERVRRLQAENCELKRKLNILTRPSGLEVEDSKLDGPLMQILFMNSTISKQYHQEIEDFISSLAERYEEQQRADHDKTYFNIKPQPSSFLLEEDYKVTCSNTSKKIKEAFSVVGSVLYFTDFCLDKLGQPILNENPQLTDGWEIPKYQQVFAQILSLDGQEIQVKPKSRPKSHCFNCGSEEHQMKDCPQPRNAARINEKRKQFKDACGETGNPNFQQRYHTDEVEERFARFKPGIISEELQDALGVTDKTLPPFIYRMRQLGYPPGWLKEAEMEKSGLTLYDGKASPGGEMEEEDNCQQKQHVTYDVSKLINYPGFNMSPPTGVSDEWRMFGSVPLQPSQQKDIFAHYLSTYHSAGPKSSSKRASSHQSSHNPKRQKGISADVSSTDMEMDSDASYSSPGYEGFQFQPPLPPGSPRNATPPPLPQGTPPCTPPKFTPPRPPASTPPPLLRNTPPSHDSAASRIDDEDTVTLEELEEQQRLILSALEQADSANSDSDIAAGPSLAGNSVASSPSRTESDVLPEAACKKLDLLEAAPSSQSEPAPTAESPEQMQVSTDDVVDLTEDDPGHADSEGTAESCPSALTCEVNLEGSGGSPAAVGADASFKNASPVPDMSKFAAGITPFEFENMAESSGVYLRIRSVLKNSPRNQLKNKKPSV